MALHSMKLSHFTGAVLVLGAMAPQTFAQSAAIVPSGPAPGAAVPSPVAPALPSAARPMTDVSFRDIEVTEVLDMISHGFDVPIVIAADVRGIILPAINLPNKTPEAAIQAIAAAAGLKYRKQADGTFLIAKNLADDPDAASAAITAPNPFQAGGNIFGGDLSLPLPQLANPNGNGDQGANSAFDIPELAGNGTRSARKRMQTIRVRNVPPSMMAYWIDPANNPIPVQFRGSSDGEKRYGPQPFGQSALNTADQLNIQSNLSAMVASPFNASNINPYTQQRDNADMRSNAQFGGGNNNGGNSGNNRGGNNRGGNNGNNRGGNNRGGAGGGGNSGVLDLPEGVDSIVAIDPQNALLVFGTDEGVRELQETIDFLDRPLKQVEIQAQFVEVQTGATDSFGINYRTARGNFNAAAGGFAPAINPNVGSLQVGFVRGNFQANLSALVSQNRAKIITSPRVTAINNLTASLLSTQSTPVILTTVVQGGGLNGQVGQGQNLLYITSTIGLTVTPTINNDDTITVLMQPQIQTQGGGVGGAPSISSNQLETIANVRDGDTIALGGLRTKKVSRRNDKIPLLGDLPLVGGLFRNRINTDQESDLIIFLTANIIRRAGDDDVVPGT
ncbi:type II and III secretion system protein [Abditibacterium utsteinense]|uniref:Type II and III secretion system protein n=2 Tax=Abditibacterium utsteinense TaxID=1960156 RepID=A0A2S8SVT5_9BACT|nr:type II and III secretion system protein [Abditibacterium utsteinense]